MRKVPTPILQRRKKELLLRLVIPQEAVRASCVEQYLTCGKKNFRCRRGRKHGPFHYLVQSLQVGTVRKFLLKSFEQKNQAVSAIAAYTDFQDRLEELSQLNTELLRRGQHLERISV